MGWDWHHLVLLLKLLVHHLKVIAGGSVWAHAHVLGRSAGRDHLVGPWGHGLHSVVQQTRQSGLTLLLAILLHLLLLHILLLLLLLLLGTSWLLHYLLLSLGSHHLLRLAGLGLHALGVVGHTWLKWHVLLIWVHVLLLLLLLFALHLKSLHVLELLWGPGHLCQCWVSFP